MHTSTRFTNVSENMYVAPAGFPKLKGKAAEIRHLGKPLRDVFTMMEDILDEHQQEYCLPADAHQCFFDAVFAFLAILTALGNWYHGQGVLLFNFTIKCHYLVHIAYYSKYYNPRAAWCYSGEDFMQTIRKLVASCQRGTPPYLVCSKTLRKYASGLSFMMLGDACWK